jgi:hypothetical protein
MKMSSKLLAAVVLAVGASSLAAPADAAPITAPSLQQNSAMSHVQTVQWRQGGRGWGWGPGIAAGLIVGGAIAATQPWGGGYYDRGYAYGPGSGYGYAQAPGYAYGPGSDDGYSPGPGYATGYGGGSDVAYCQQRFRSFDPASGTYMGYDGLRHPCP